MVRKKTQPTTKQSKTHHILGSRRSKNIKCTNETKKRNAPFGIEVPQVDGLLLPAVDARDGAGDLAGHEGRATARALVVEKDAVGEVHPVRLKKKKKTRTKKTNERNRTNNNSRRTDERTGG